MHNPIAATKSTYAKLREHFNVSFWCTVYNVWLMVVMCVSIVLSAVVYLFVEVIQNARASHRRQRASSDAEMERDQSFSGTRV